MRRQWLVALLVPVLTVALQGVEPGEIPMSIVRAEQVLRDQVVAWVNDTPIFQQELFFEVSVKVGDKILQGEYQPNSVWESLPVFWQPGTEVQGRVHGHSLFLKRPNGVEIRFVILKRTPASAIKK